MRHARILLTPVAMFIVAVYAFARIQFTSMAIDLAIFAGLVIHAMFASIRIEDRRVGNVQGALWLGYVIELFAVVLASWAFFIDKHVLLGAYAVPMVVILILCMWRLPFEEWRGSPKHSTRSVFYGAIGCLLLLATTGVWLLGWMFFAPIEGNQANWGWQYASPDGRTRVVVDYVGHGVWADDLIVDVRGCTLGLERRIERGSVDCAECMTFGWEPSRWVSECTHDRLRDVIVWRDNDTMLYYVPDEADKVGRFERPWYLK